jgi:hypothetical protein
VPDKHSARQALTKSGDSLASGSTPQGKAEPSIRLEKVSKTYGTGETQVAVLSEVSLEVMPG